MPRGDASRKRCAIYTRKSSEEGLEQEFNSLAAQREACEAFIRSQRDEGWVLARTRYDDGGFSGGKYGAARAARPARRYPSPFDRLGVRLIGLPRGPR
jgi:DNA invertase Pin-like site-specific DNA recombinase